MPRCQPDPLSARGGWGTWSFRSGSTLLTRPVCRVGRSATVVLAWSAGRRTARICYEGRALTCIRRCQTLQPSILMIVGSGCRRSVVVRRVRRQTENSSLLDRTPRTDVAVERWLRPLVIKAGICSPEITQLGHGCISDSAVSTSRTGTGRLCSTTTVELNLNWIRQRDSLTDRVLITLTVSTSSSAAAAAIDS